MNNSDNKSISDKETSSISTSNSSTDSAQYSIYDTFIQIKTPLKRFISRHLVSSNDIDDIAHEAFLRAYEAEKKKLIDKPSAFLFRIARNLIFSEAKKKSSKFTDYIEDFEHEDILLTDDNLEDNVIAQQKVGILCEAVASLPPKCRRVFLLKKVYGMSHKEISENMGITVSTIEKHLSKAIRDCSKVLADRYDNHTSSPDKTENRQGFSSKKGI